ncbi:hypothetical protein OSB04_010474 [Centaurea solstitialis]|uniref:Uncharacterized protein n=1 Tax=Centaurea solstitialis TaxID=347529 RepID=A0AA38WKP0_9ASTR|nr:hypothetical protein OSB04_010474 [Centaurea solstitialis]
MLTQEIRVYILHVPWNAMIGGYIQAKRFKDALAITKIKPDGVTMVYYLSACSQIGALDLGIWFHRYIKKHNLPIAKPVNLCLSEG